jgi:hypothetical protein
MTGEHVQGVVVRRKRGELTIRTANGLERYLRESEVEDLTAAVERVTCPEDVSREVLAASVSGRASSATPTP